MADYREGGRINVGDQVGFKEGVEQYGKVLRVDGMLVVLEMWDEDRGYVNRNITASKLWKDA